MPKAKVKRAKSFVDEIDLEIEELTDWLYDEVTTTIKALSPNGRPFGMEELSDSEKLKQYLQIRGSLPAWVDWIEQRVVFIEQQLQAQGLDDQAILGVHPYDIAERLAIRYSADCEELLRRSTGGNKSIPSETATDGGSTDSTGDSTGY